MAAFNFFDSFAVEFAKGTHDLHTDTVKVYLSNATPSASGDSVKGDLAEITAENGYSAGGVDIENAVSADAPGAEVAAADKTITAENGTIGPFRYAVAYNDDKSDKLIGWWDRGDAITLQDGESVDLDFITDLLLTLQPAA